MHPDAADTADTALRYNLLDEPLIRWRCITRGETHRSSLPELFVAMAANELRDFPALRPHQRHSWHAFLTQLAAIAMHRQGQAELWTSAADWRAALLALTPDDADGAAWCLVSPPDRPALLQAPVPGGSVDDWKNVSHAADALDMLVTSKNHDLKGARVRRGEPDDWFFALLSLQTQEGFLGAGNYGISRMNGGFASRPGVGVAALGGWGQRWLSDLKTLLSRRESIAEANGLAFKDGHALLWLLPWSGTESLAMQSLDPLYIEVCRRVRLGLHGDILVARSTGSKAARVAAQDRSGMTGDAWTPVDIEEHEALTVSASGFNYKLMSELLVGSRFKGGAAQAMDHWPEDSRLQLVAQATARGKGKTAGYHERHVPISPALRRLLLGPRRANVEQITRRRIDDIAALRELLRGALVVLFANGEGKTRNESISKKAGRFARPFEQREDARFFLDLSHEVEADETQRAEQRVQWLLGLVARAEGVLREAFDAGPRNGMQRYKARAAAISRFRGGLRGPKPVLKDLADHYRQQSAAADTKREASNHV
jgi:CRISPR system Cascade subunit CasA